MSAPAPKPNNRKIKSPQQAAIAAPDPPASIAEGNVVSDGQEPKAEEIALLAYSYWEARDRQGGSAEEDWLRAEQELRGR